MEQSGSSLARSWFVISARLVFDLKAVFACGVCAFLLWERERRERDGEKEEAAVRETEEGVNYISGGGKWKIGRKKDASRSFDRVCAVPIRGGVIKGPERERRGQFDRSDPTFNA